MTARSPKFIPEPRGLTGRQIAVILGMSETWFAINKDKLIKNHGFPGPSPVTGRYDAKAVNLWYDRHSGIKAGNVITDGADGWRAGLDALADEDEATRGAA